jgi:hypothetical protein
VQVEAEQRTIFLHISLAAKFRAFLIRCTASLILSTGTVRANLTYPRRAQKPFRGRKDACLVEHGDTKEEESKDKDLSEIERRRRLYHVETDTLQPVVKDIPLSWCLQS